MIVVTGAAGFIGRALVAALDAAGEQVVAIDRRPLSRLSGQAAARHAGRSQATDPARTAGAAPALAAVGSGVTALVADLTADRADVAEALRAADAVFHLAGRPGVRDADPAADRLRRRDNVVATAAVLAHTPLDVPLLVASSSAVYGGSQGGRACRETDALRPLGGYARSKAAAEWLCAQRRQRGGAITVVRPFTVVGEGQRPDMAVSRFLAAVGAGRPVRLHGSPTRTRDLTDVRDVVRVLRDLAARGASGPVNIGTGTPHTLAEIVAAVSRALGRPAEVVVVDAPPDDPAATRADTRRLRRLLGYQPRTNLDDVVTRQLAAAHPEAGARLALAAR